MADAIQAGATKEEAIAAGQAAMDAATGAGSSAQMQDKKGHQHSHAAQRQMRQSPEQEARWHDAWNNTNHT
jgi:thioesterase domain-containing protein